MTLSHIVSWAVRHSMREVFIREVNREKYKYSVRGVSYLYGYANLIKKEVNCIDLDCVNAVSPWIYRDYEKNLQIKINLRS